MLIFLRRARFHLRRLTTPRAALLLACALAGCLSRDAQRRQTPNFFMGFTTFSSWSKESLEDRQVLVSPPITAPIFWNELVVSWNTDLARSAGLEIEAGPADSADTRYYHLGRWSGDGGAFPRASVKKQRDSVAEVKTDTLVLKTRARSVRIRISLLGQPASASNLKFLGLSFCDTSVAPPALASNRRAWGRTLPVPERSQLGHRDASGWCSPASVAMVLNYWGGKFGRSEWLCSVPQAAQGVYDPNWPGTGNWPFNTAYAGSFSGMRAYITRLDDLAEVEEWIALGIPVILSAPYNLLSGNPSASAAGHVVVCAGFTREGDVIINDPFTHLERGERVQRVYRRRNVERAWWKSHNTVYLIYPENVPIPPNPRGHWESALPR